MPTRRRGAPGSFGAPLQEIVPRFPAEAIRADKQREARKSRPSTARQREAAVQLNQRLADPASD